MMFTQKPAVPEESGNTAPFFYLASQADQKIMANDADKYLFLQYIGAESIHYGIAIHSFILLDDQAHLVVGRRGGLWGEEQVRVFQEKMFTGFIREQAEQAFQKNRFTKTDDVIREQRACGFYSPEENDIRYHEERTCMALPEYEEALHYCMRIHLLAVRKGYVSGINDYWWSSYQTYRQNYDWPFVSTNPILSRLASDTEEAGRIFRKLQRSEARKEMRNGEKPLPGNPKAL